MHKLQLSSSVALFIFFGSGNSLKSPASTAYAQVFAPHHNWAIRKAVAAGMYALPTKAQLLMKLNEDGEFIFDWLFQSLIPLLKNAETLYIPSENEMKFRWFSLYNGHVLIWTIITWTDLQDSLIFKSVFFVICNKHLVWSDQRVQCGNVFFALYILILIFGQKLHVCKGSSGLVCLSIL